MAVRRFTCSLCSVFCIYFIYLNHFENFLDQPLMPIFKSFGFVNVFSKLLMDKKSLSCRESDISDGTFPFPFFHKTSDNFAEFNMRNGLTTSNVLEKYRVIELAREIVSLLHESNIGIDLYEDENQNPVSLLNNMNNQNITAKNLNFWHGSPYLTANKSLAEMYSLNEKYYEILTQVYLCAFLIPVEQNLIMLQYFQKTPQDNKYYRCNASSNNCCCSGFNY